MKCRRMLPKVWQDAPVPIAFDVAPRHLKETAGAVVGDSFLCYTPRAPNLVALHAVEEVFEGVQAEVGARGARVEGGFVVVGLRLQRSGGVVVVMARDIGWIGARTEDVRVRAHGGHRSGGVFGVHGRPTQMRGDGPGTGTASYLKACLEEHISGRKGQDNRW